MKHMDEYRHMMDSLQVPDEQQQHILETVLAQAEKSKQAAPKHHRHIVRTIIIVAAAMSMLIASASATDILKSVGQIFAPIFGTPSQETQMYNREQIDIIERLGRKIENASVTDQGITISADAVIGDPYLASIAYTVSWDETITMPKRLNTENLAFHMSNSDSIYFIDTDPSDSKLQCVQSVSSMQIEDLSNFTIDMEDLMYGADTVAKGHWKFTFDARYADTTVSLAHFEKMQMNDYEVEIYNLNLSPMGIRLYYQSQIKISQEELKQFSSIPITVTKTDGTQINLIPSKEAETQGGNNYTSCSRAWTFDKIIPLEEIALVTVGDLEYPFTVKNPTAKQLALINEIGRTVEGISVTDNGTTLSVDAVLADAYRTMISYTFSWDETVNIHMPDHILNSNNARVSGERGRNFIFEETEIEFNTEGGGSYGVAHFIDEDPTDRKIQLIQIMESSSEIKNLNNLMIDFKNFSYYDDADDSIHPIIQGEWAMTFDASCKDTSISLANEETFDVEGMEVIVKKISVSPLGIRWTYETDDPRIARLDTEDWTEEQIKTGFHLLDVFRDIPIFCNKTDGTKINLLDAPGDIGVTCNQPGGSEDDPFSRFVAIGSDMYNFEQIVPLDEIESITFGEITYTVPHK